MRWWILSLMVVFGCDVEPEGDAASDCEALQTSNEGCFPDELMEECVAKWEACDGELTVMESCPIQFGCAE